MSEKGGRERIREEGDGERGRKSEWEEDEGRGER